jgi:hypothetical protein
MSSLSLFSFFCWYPVALNEWPERKGDPIESGLRSIPITCHIATDGRPSAETRKKANFLHFP